MSFKDQRPKLIECTFNETIQEHLFSIRGMEMEKTELCQPFMHLMLILFRKHLPLVVWVDVSFLYPSKTLHLVPVDGCFSKECVLELGKERKPSLFSFRRDRCTALLVKWFCLSVYAWHRFGVWLVLLRDHWDDTVLFYSILSSHQTIETCLSFFVLAQEICQSSSMVKTSMATNTPDARAKKFSFRTFRSFSMMNSTWSIGSIKPFECKKNRVKTSIITLERWSLNYKCIFKRWITRSKKPANKPSNSFRGLSSHRSWVDEHRRWNLEFYEKSMFWDTKPLSYRNRCERYEETFRKSISTPLTACATWSNWIWWKIEFNRHRKLYKKQTIGWHSPLRSIAPSKRKTRFR